MKTLPQRKKYEKYYHNAKKYEKPERNM